MPNELALTDAKALHASGTETLNGTGASIELGDRSYVELTLDVTALTGTLQVTVETSATQSRWSLAGRFPLVTEPGDYTFIVPDAKQYLRATWQLTGSGRTATFSLTGTAYQLYVKPQDIDAYFSATGRNVLNGVDIREIAKSCLAASDEAAVYLANSYDMPITSLDAATKRHIAAMAAFDLFRFRTLGNSGVGKETLEVGRSEATVWLTKVSSGKLKPAGVVDATPGNDAPGIGISSGSAVSPFVVGRVSRGWGS